MTDQVDSPPKTKPVVTWIRVDKRRGSKATKVKHQLKEPPSSSAGSTVIVNQAMLPTPTVTITSKWKRRKKTPNIESAPNLKIIPQLTGTKAAITNSKAAERRRKANRIRKKADSRPSRAPTLRRHRQRKQRILLSPAVLPANPQSRQEDIFAEQQSKEGADATVSAPGRS
jgi:hypothetical protein